MTKNNRVRQAALAAVVVAVASTSQLMAQTSGSLQPMASSNWTTAPWTITSGAGTFPTDGGVATFLNPINVDLGGTGGVALTLDQTITLSQLNYNSPFTTNIAGTNSLALAATGGTFNVALSSINTPTLIQLTNAVTAPISGGGSAGLTKSGIGNLTIGTTNTVVANGPVSVANTYTGGTHVNGGFLVVQASAAVGDSAFGASGAGISFNGGTIFNNITGGWTTSRPIFLDAGGGTIYTNSATTLNGVISGPGSFTPRGFASVNTVLTAANTYSGPTITSTASNTSLVLSGNGSILNSSALDLAGSFQTSNTATNNNNRISDTAPITVRGFQSFFGGNATAPTSETIGAITIANGSNIITVSPNAAQSDSLTIASLTRQNKATLAVRGAGLGAPLSAGTAQILVGTLPATVGGGGAVGSTNQSIVPWINGNNISTAFNGATHVTTGPTGLRPLGITEYATDFTSSATDNVRLTGDTATSGGTANAVLFAPAVEATLSGGTINVGSGSFLYSPTSTPAAAATVTNNLNFGANEGILSASSALTVTGVISGTGGLTVNGYTGVAMLLSGANTYTGPTVLSIGALQFAGTITNDGTPSPLGAGTSASSPIILSPGFLLTTFYSTAANSVINRDIVVSGTGQGSMNIGSGADFSLTINGNINLQRNLNIDAGTGLSSATVLNGVISGNGLISSGRASSQIVFNASNTFAGGINLTTSTLYAGANSAFGVGTIYVSGLGFIRNIDTTPRTLTNDMFLSSTVTFAGAGSLNVTGPVNLNGVRTIAVTNTAPTILSGALGNGTLLKTGNGVLTLSSPTGSTFTGGVFLNDSVTSTGFPPTTTTTGGLIVNNTSGSGTGAGTVYIGSATALGGSFTISGLTGISGSVTGANAAVAGRLSPGNSGNTAATVGVNSIGIANFTTTLDTAGTLALEVASRTSYDRVVVGGELVFEGGSVVLSTISGYSMTAGTYNFLDWGTLTLDTAPTLDISGLVVAAGVTLNTSNFFIDGTIIASGGGIVGDGNGDGFVDAADYTVWADHFGQSGSNIPGDYNNDGTVNAADYTVWADHFGQGTPPGGVSAVPEPTALAFLAPAGLLLSRRRR